MTERTFPTGRPQALGVATLAAALLAGCSLIPGYERPTAPVPSSFGTTAAPAAPGLPPDAATLPGWQDYFGDPTLHALIDAALANNRDLRVALAQVEQARALAGVARADRFPTLSAGASGSRSRTPADLNSSGAAVTSSRYDVNLGVTAFELDFWGRVAALGEAARAQYLASDEAARSFRVSLIGDVASTWYQLAALSEQSRLADDTLRTRTESLALIRKRAEIGLANDLDVLAAESLVETVRVQASDLARQRAQTENALRLLVGTVDAMPPAPAISNLPPLSELTPGLPSDVLLRRPDVRAAEQRLIATNASIGAARAAFFPRIALTGEFGTASSALSGLFGGGSAAWLFQPVLSLPLFDAGRTQANLEVAEARKVQAVAEYEKTVQQAFREVADALAARANYGKQVQAQEANLRTQEARLERVQARERAGIASYLEVLDASRDAFGAQQAVVAARLQALSARVALYKALGGGT